MLGQLRAGVPTPGDTLRLAHDENFFGVRFATLDFRAPGRHLYRYRLAGVDDDWRQADAESPRAAYTDVPPGTYRFEVVGTTHRGDEGGAPAVLTVAVVPAWWQTRWARLFAIVALLAAAAWAVAENTRYRVAAVEAKRQETIEVQRRLADGRERERRRLARDLHDGPVQGLYRVGHDLDALERLVGDRADDIRETRARLGEISGELREMLGQLRPTLALHLPLPDALDALANRFERRRGVRVETDYRTTAAQADGASRLVLFRITQEALANVARHAHASDGLDHAPGLRRRAVPVHRGRRPRLRRARPARRVRACGALRARRHGRARRVRRRPVPRVPARARRHGRRGDGAAPAGPGAGRAAGRLIPVPEVRVRRRLESVS